MASPLLGAGTPTKLKNQGRLVLGEQKVVFPVLPLKTRVHAAMSLREDALP